MKEIVKGLPISVLRYQDDIDALYDDAVVSGSCDEWTVIPDQA